MQGNSILYEVTKNIQNKDVVQNDLKEVFNMTTNLFKEKYINKLQVEVKNHKSTVEKNPPKEVILLKALKAFTPGDNHKDIDNLISTIVSINTFNSIKRDFETSRTSEVGQENTINDISVATAQVDSSIKHDGIYDYDVNCVSENNFSIGSSSSSMGILMLSMLLFNK